MKNAMTLPEAFLRSAIGFDRIFDNLNRLPEVTRNDIAFPPYNLEKTGDESYRITMAVAGFNKNDVTITVNDGTLSVNGSVNREEESNSGEVLYRGIAKRAFQRNFRLAEYVEVMSANMENGLLTIDLERRVPEERKPRTIAINGSGGSPSSIESSLA